jgi:PIN domain nuclease of toxin-antitoxin system
MRKPPDRDQFCRRQYGLRRRDRVNSISSAGVAAWLLCETDGEKVEAALVGALLGAVNRAEIVCHCAKLGASRPNNEAMLRPLPTRVVPVDAVLSYEASMLRPLTLPGGLSLGERSCLALAKREGVPALMAKRLWPGIAAAASRST